MRAQGEVIVLESVNLKSKAAGVFVSYLSGRMEEDQFSVLALRMEEDWLRNLALRADRRKIGFCVYSVCMPSFLDVFHTH